MVALVVVLWWLFVLMKAGLENRKINDIVSLGSLRPYTDLVDGNWYLVCSVYGIFPTLRTNCSCITAGLLILTKEHSNEK